MHKTPALSFTDLIMQLPRRSNDAHKGNFGHVLVIGGDFGYAGAPVLAALGALRVGAGLVTLASRKEHLLGLNASYPELMTVAIDDPSALDLLFSKATVIVLGPGLGRSTWSQDVFNRVIQIDKPLVLDADGLFFLAQQTQPHENLVITPHPGEAAALLNQDTAIAIDQRLNAIKELIQRYKCTVVLKGTGTLVGNNNTNIQRCTAGNPGMASGGMGDLLSGVIAGLIAQGLDCTTAAKLGVCVHAMAGDKAATDFGQRGIIATDLLSTIRALLG